MQQCQNCEKSIGNMERSFEWQGSTVCTDCFELLRRPVAAPIVGAAPAAQRAIDVTCPNPNCGFVGVPRIAKRGNDAICVLLFLCGLIPGLLYAIFAYGWDYSCRKCNTVLNPSQAVKNAINREIRVMGRMAFLAREEERERISS